MSISGPLTLLITLALIAIVLAIAYRRHWLDVIAHRLEGPPAPPEQRSHLRVIRNGPPRCLPGGTSPCDLAYWDGPEDVA